MIQLDYNLLSQKLREFIAFINKKSDMIFTDFDSNPYIYQNESYKAELRITAFNKLNYMAWNKNSIGKGKIFSSLIDCIELKQNNLVMWQNRYGKNTKDHRRLFELKENEEQLELFEKNTFDFFHSKILDKAYFSYLLEIAGKKYALIAYLFFIKNPQKYLPISTTNFDNLFKDLKIDLITTQNCSWQNYQEYLDVIRSIQVFLQENFFCDISFLDAHSFCWIITSQMRNEKIEVIHNYSLNIPEKDRDTIIKSRIGQGLFRKELLSKWNNSSSISDYSNNKFLIASHIKPWKDCTNQEALDPDNGLLLSPNYDYLFDNGFISFSENGVIAVSNELKSTDILELNINTGVKIKKLNNKTKKYLQYHFINIFRK